MYEELVKLHNTKWNEDTKQLVEHSHAKVEVQRCKILAPTTADININSVCVQTTIGEPFLLADNDTSSYLRHTRILPFATADAFYGDSTPAHHCFT